ncbi:MAG: histidine triad nucleotide-binding protein [Desulfobacteraceae bacterium IS3]|nr:MAG: histidine triad nucleotide-binding protein [Desulfobacteraceae bacterium IS3]HAO20486.1 histidine triad nucleotide-binding protein [Desulfobacteraceae bacterium]
MEKDCLFCKIANREMETQFLYETENVVVFRDIHPEAPVHLLIVPKKHIRSLNDVSDEDRNILGGLLLVAKEMAKKEGVNESGYRVVTNVEKGGGQMIFHLHLHLIGGWKR